MNVIFLDFDGVLDTVYYKTDEDLDRKIKILGDICHKYDCKVVIEASAKDAIDEETMEIEGRWVNKIFELFNKYDIDCIGRTPTVPRKLSKTSCYPIWKEDEIRLYLYRHPEIEHYCVIDDDDLGPRNSDLNKVRDHLVMTDYYCEEHPELEGLLETHSAEVGKALQKENEIRKMLLKRKKR